MFQLDLKSRKSIYEQVIDNLRDLILSNVLRPEEKLPSVRELSKTLTVNPNTIQKAYRELERQRYVYTVSGLGTFVEKAEYREQDEELRLAGIELLRRGMRELYLSGMTAEDAEAASRKLLRSEYGADNRAAQSKNETADAGEYAADSRTAQTKNEISGDSEYGADNRAAQSKNETAGDIAQKGHTWEGKR